MPDWINKLLVVLVATGIIGIVGMYSAQGQIKKQTERLEREQERTRDAVALIPVIQRDIEHIRKDLDKSQEAILKKLDEIAKRRG